MELRDYQHKCLNDIYHSLKKNKSTALQAPTGSGKTEIAIEFIKRCVRQNYRCLFIIRSIKLINQTYDRFAPHFPNCGVIRSTDRRRKKDSLVNILSVDTYLNWKNSNKDIYEFDKADVIIVDEAQDCSGFDNGYVKMLNESNAKKILGLSATFQRIGRKGHNFWDNIICNLSGWELRAKNILPPLIRKAPDISYSLAGVKINASGDYSSSKVMSILEADKFFYSSFDKEFKEYGIGKKSILFCINIKHAEQMKKRVAELGGHPILFHSGMSMKDASKAKEELNNKIKNNKEFCICSVNMLSRGVDIPCLEVGFMLRPTCSEVLYRQQVGRLTRGHKPVTLIDLTTNSRKFSHPYTLLPADTETYKGSLRVEKNECITCESCFIVLEKQHQKNNKCIVCGGKVKLEKGHSPNRDRKTLDIGLTEVEDDPIEKNEKIIRKGKFIKDKYRLDPHYEYTYLYKHKKKEILKSIENLFSKIKNGTI